MTAIARRKREPVVCCLACSRELRPYAPCLKVGLVVVGLSDFKIMIEL